MKNMMMYTVAQMIGHTAQSIEWFIDDAFHRADGFDLNFDNYAEAMKKFTSLKQSVEYFEKTIQDAIQTIGNASEEELVAPLPEGPVMGGAPKVAVVSALADHTAHHRGALSVYARLLGKVPSMPYGEM
jgi:uncharacterized damage-inducible protein DinB